MNLISFFYLFITGAVLAVLLYVIALTPLLEKAQHQPILAYNDVRGMAVESNKVLYTLNFEQQKKIIAEINKEPSDSLNGKLTEKTSRVPNEVIGECASSIDRLIIYRFNQPDWVLIMEK